MIWQAETYFWETYLVLEKWLYDLAANDAANSHGWRILRVYDVIEEKIKGQASDYARDLQRPSKFYTWPLKLYRSK